MFSPSPRGEGLGEGIIAAPHNSSRKRFSHPLSCAVNPNACINAAITPRSSTPTSAIHHEFTFGFSRITSSIKYCPPDTATTGYVTHAQRVQSSLRAAQGYANRGQQALVEARGINAMVLVDMQRRRGILRPRSCQVDMILSLKVTRRTIVSFISSLSKSN